MRGLSRWLFVVVLLLASCGDDSADADGADGEIVVFAAASLTDAFEEVATAFEDANPGSSVELSLASSSSLREQIIEGAPADVFASADQSNMDELVEADEASLPEVFVRNELQIAVPTGNDARVTGLADFSREELLVGLCAEEVPCGRFGRQALANAGVDPAQDTDEPDVRSLLSKVESGELDAGLVYRTDVLAAGDGVEGIEIPEEDNVTAAYPIAVLTRSSAPEVAAAFVAFVLADEGQAILASYGFEAP